MTHSFPRVTFWAISMCVVVLLSCSFESARLLATRGDIQGDTAEDGGRVDAGDPQGDAATRGDAAAPEGGSGDPTEADAGPPAGDSNPGDESGLGDVLTGDALAGDTVAPGDTTVGGDTVVVCTIDAQEEDDTGATATQISSISSTFDFAGTLCVDDPDFFRIEMYADTVTAWSLHDVVGSADVGLVHSDCSDGATAYGCPPDSASCIVVPDASGVVCSEVTSSTTADYVFRAVYAGACTPDRTDDTWQTADAYAVTSRDVCPTNTDWYAITISSDLAVSVRWDSTEPFTYSMEVLDAQGVPYGAACIADPDRYTCNIPHAKPGPNNQTYHFGVRMNDWLPTPGSHNYTATVSASGPVSDPCGGACGKFETCCNATFEAKCISFLMACIE